MLIQPLVYIIVLNWNNWEDTLRCLESIQGFSYSNYHTIVVDNSSTNNSIDQIKRWGVESRKAENVIEAQLSEFSMNKLVNFSFSEIHLNENLTLIENHENAGFSGGCNLGIAYALLKGADYVFLLNTDTEFDSDLLDNVVNASKDTNSSIVGARVLDIEKNSNNISEEIALFTKSNFHTYFFQSSKKSKPDVNQKYWETILAAGAALLLKQDILQDRYKEDGYYLNTQLFMYCEEIDLCFYGLNKGYKCCIARDAIVKHEVSSTSSGQGNPRTTYYCTRNRILLANRWLDLKWKLLFHLYYIPSRLALTSSRVILRQRSLRSVSSIVAGILDGYKGLGGKWIHH
jgi:GT2 family glycosyltransferase